MSKSRDAFRTISEVSDVLDAPAHVLRFWESKFTQVKPVKRAGGRRYYRPADVDLLAGIKRLLHDDGMTIKGAQKLLREQGVKHVSALGADALAAAAPATPDLSDDLVEETAQNVADDAAPAAATPTAAPEDTPQVQDTPQVNTAPEQPAEIAAQVEITNVIPLATSTDPKPAGPALTVNLEPAAPKPTPSIPKVTVPDDPADNDSKAPARVFHVLHKTPHDKLAARAADIAPLLARMQGLRDRIVLR